MLTREENEFITRTGPGTPMGEFWRRFWAPALLPSELPEPDCPPVRLRLLGEDLVAFRDTSGKVGLLAANCPHRGASLFFGRNEEQGLRCVYHGWKYDVTGQCVDMPNEPPESNFRHKIKHTAYPCEERAGIIWTYMGPKDLLPQLPELEWAMVPESHRYISKIWVESNYLQALEGDIDNSHVPFAHGLLAGPLDAPFLERVRAAGAVRQQRMGRGGLQTQVLFAQDLTPRGVVKDTDYGIVMGWRRNADPEHYYWRINHWMLPSHVMLASPPGNSMTCNSRIPMDDENSWHFRVTWHPERPLTQEQLDYLRSGQGYPELVPGTFRPKANKDNDYLIDRELQRTSSVTGIMATTQQDRAVTESMGAIYDRTKEHLGTSDMVIIAMRRRLMKLARELGEGREPYAAHHGEVYRQRGADLLLKREAPWEEGARELMAVHK